MAQYAVTTYNTSIPYNSVCSCLLPFQLPANARGKVANADPSVASPWQLFWKPGVISSWLQPNPTLIVVAILQVNHFIPLHVWHTAFKNKKSGAVILAAHCTLGTLLRYSGLNLKLERWFSYWSDLLLIQLVKALGMQWLMVQVFGPLPTKWETQMEFLAAGFHNGSHLGNDPEDGKLCLSLCIFISLPFCLSNKKILYMHNILGTSCTHIILSI